MSMSYQQILKRIGNALFRMAKRVNLIVILVKRAKICGKLLVAEEKVELHSATQLSPFSRAKLNTRLMVLMPN